MRTSDESSIDVLRRTTGAFSRKPELTGEQEERLRVLGHRLASGGGLHLEDYLYLAAFFQTQGKNLAHETKVDDIIEFLNGYEAFESAYTGASEDQRGREDREYS